MFSPSQLQQYHAPHKLTKKQQLILAAVARTPRASTRELAERLAISRRTVQSAVKQFEEHAFVATTPGGPGHGANLYRVLVGGLIPAELPQDVAQFAPQACGKNDQYVAQIAPVRGAICGKQGGFPQNAYIGTRAHTYSPVSRELEAVVGNSSGAGVENPPTAKAQNPSREDQTQASELVEMVSTWFAPLDGPLQARIRSLPHRFAVSAVEVTHFWEQKWRAKQRRREQIYHAGAFLQYTEEDLPAWLAQRRDGPAPRKPVYNAGALHHLPHESLEARS